MFIACAPIGGLAPLARRLRCLLLAGACTGSPHLPMPRMPICVEASPTILQRRPPMQTMRARAPTVSIRPSRTMHHPARAICPKPRGRPRIRGFDFLLDNIRVGAVLPDDDTVRAQRENLRAARTGTRFPPEADPYAPIGIRAGSFILKPSLEQGIKATSNGDNSSNGSRAILNETTLAPQRPVGLVAASGPRSMHPELSANPSPGRMFPEPQANILGRLRLGSRQSDHTVNAETSYCLRRESASSPNGVVDALKRPLVHFRRAPWCGVTRACFSAALPAGLSTTCMAMPSLLPVAPLPRKTATTPMPAWQSGAGFALPGAETLPRWSLANACLDERIDSNGYERGGRQLCLCAAASYSTGVKNSTVKSQQVYAGRQR